MSDNLAYLPLARSMFSDALWKERRVFSKFEALLWLIEGARYARSSDWVQIGLRSVEVRRGQLVRSQVAMAREWRWSRGKVQRYLEELQKAGTIRAENVHQACRITLCNYGAYNKSRAESEHQNTDRAPNEHQTGHQTSTKPSTKRAPNEHQTSGINPCNDGTYDDSRAPNEHQTSTKRAPNRAPNEHQTSTKRGTQEESKEGKEGKERKGKRKFSPLDCFVDGISEEMLLVAVEADWEDLYVEWVSHRLSIRKRQTRRTVEADIRNIGRVLSVGGDFDLVRSWFGDAMDAPWTGWFFKDKFETWSDVISAKKRGGKKGAAPVYVRMGERG